MARNPGIEPGKVTALETATPHGVFRVGGVDRGYQALSFTLQMLGRRLQETSVINPCSLVRPDAKSPQSSFLALRAPPEIRTRTSRF